MPNDPTKILPLASTTESMGHAPARSGSRRRMDVILSKNNARGLIRSLPTEDLYTLIKDVGTADAEILIGMATPEQFQGFIDLEAWDPSPEGACLEPARVFEWLELARDAEPESYREKIQALDLEIIEIIIRGGLLIVDRREEEEAATPPPRPGSPDLAWDTTPCGHLYIAYTDPDSNESKALRRMIAEIYAMDAFGAARLLSAIRVELDADLSEAALRVRTARMEDMGFPPLEVALELYAQRRPEIPLPPQPAAPDTIPGFELARLPQGSLLQRAASRIGGVAPRTQLDRSLLYLGNMALVADRVAPHDDEAVRTVSERVHATLSLALEQLSGADEDQATEILRAHALKPLFQIGFTLTLKLQHAVTRALREAEVSATLAPALFDDPERSTLVGLLASRPTLSRSLIEARRRGWPLDPTISTPEGEAILAELPEGQRPFEHLQEIELAQLAIDQIVAGLRLVGPEGPLHLEAPTAPDAPALSGRIASLLLARAAGESGPLAPLSVDLATRGLAALFTPEGALLPSAWEPLVQELAKVAPNSAPLLARALIRLASAARPIYEAGDRPDPRYLGLLWLKG